MTIAFYLFFHDRANKDRRIAPADLDRFIAIAGSTPKLSRLHAYTPSHARDPYTNDPAPPMLAAQLYFDDLPELEAALAPDGHLQALARPGTLPSLDGAQVEQQAMLSRRFAVPDPTFHNAPGTYPCTFLVEYPGAAEDLNAWLWHYIVHHPPLMVQLPKVRDVEICTRVDWCGFLPWPRVDRMQRNKVVFDSQADLQASLESPVRHAMRRDFESFPKFTGGNMHYPLDTRIIRPG